MRGTQFDRQGRKWLTVVGAPRQRAVGRRAQRWQARPMVEGSLDGLESSAVPAGTSWR
jgi:hypothetical protein